jgi:predicted site-specific integrase-resolvase
VVREIGSGVNDRRPQCLHLLADPLLRVIVVEHQDRATRFGFRALETLLAQQGRHIEVVNLAEKGREDNAREDNAREDNAREDNAREDNAREDNAREEGIADLVAIVDSFCERPSGQRRASPAKRKTAAMVNALTDQKASQEASVAGEGEGEHASR